MGASAEAIERYIEAFRREKVAEVERSEAASRLLESAGWSLVRQPGSPLSIWQKRLDDGRTLAADYWIALEMEGIREIRERAYQAARRDLAG